VAIGLAGYPSFLRAAEEVDLAVISGEPAAATRKALEALGGIGPLSKKDNESSSNPHVICRTPTSPRQPIRWSFSQWPRHVSIWRQEVLI
jgi:hypothetical protein